MPDDLDMAQAVEEFERGLALAAARRRAQQFPSFRFCFDCGAAIPEARRRAIPGATRCAACQADREAGR